MHSRLKLVHKGIILVAVPVLIELALMACHAQILSQAESEIRKEAHAKEIIEKTNLVMKHILSAAGGAGANNMLHTTDFSANYDQSIKGIPAEFEKLKQILSEDSAKVASAQKLQDDWNQATVLFDRAKRLVEANRWIEVRKEMPQLKALLTHLTDQLDAIVKDEERIKDINLENQARLRATTKQLLLAGVIINVLLAMMLVAWFITGTTRRVKVLTNNAERLPQGLPLNPLIGGQDEIAELDLVFHKMAKALDDANRKQRAVVDNATEVICSIDKTGRFAEVNPAAEKLWGYTAEELNGRRLISLISEGDVDHTTKCLNALRFEGANKPFESRLIAKSGQAMDVQWSMHWAEAEQSWFCVAHDITERRKLEIQKQEFVALVSHDLRTPLTAIEAFISILETGDYGQINEVGQARIDTIEKSLQRLMRLINDLLDLDKLEAGAMPLELASCNLNSVVESSLNAVEAFAEKQNVEIATSGKPITIDADKERLVQVLVNLLSNAVKFAPAGSKVTISTERQGTHAKVCVSDCGRGIPHEQQMAIFEKFHQVEIGDSKKKGGTGLGLPICKAIVEQHGGQIGVESNQERGSTFWFTVPLTHPS